MKLATFMMPLHPPGRKPAETLAEDREAILLADQLGYAEAYVGEHVTDLAENVTSSLMFLASVAQNLLAAQQLQVDLIYHFNGQTYGPVANAAEAAGPVASNNGLCRSSYGIDAMRQMLIIQK